MLLASIVTSFVAPIRNASAPAFTNTEKRYMLFFRVPARPYEEAEPPYVVAWACACVGDMEEDDFPGSSS